MMSTTNGCICRYLQNDEKCVSCCARARSKEHCRVCNVGTLVHEITSMNGHCTEHYYDSYYAHSRGEEREGDFDEFEETCK